MDKKDYTPVADIPKIHAELNASFNAGKIRKVAFRKKQLARLAYLVKDNMEAIHQALAKDLGRNRVDTIAGDTAIVLHEAVHAYNNVEKWAKDVKPSTTITFQLMDLRVKPTPKGVVLIISPFNFPFNLTLTPLVGALAAGCTAVLKLPESLPTVSPLIQRLIEQYMDRDVVRVVQGAVPETTELLNLRWDHIFFTGSGRVGRVVATAAAKYGTPTTLELGGKCPTIIDPRGADFSIIARRVLWGRLMNTGQVCVSPDYVLIPKEHQDAFVKALTRAYKDFHPQGPTSFGRLVNEGSTLRIKSYLDGTQGSVVIGGDTDDTDRRYLGPTIVRDVKGDDSTMQDEIFGPLLSIVPVDHLDDAIKFVNERPQPLALYVFTKDSAFKAKVTENTRSGSIVYNDTMAQVGAPGLPFGGSGGSGYGQYHGKYGFDTFTHFRASMNNPTWLESVLSFRYPPVTGFKETLAICAMEPIVFPFNREGKTSTTSRIRRLFLPLTILAVVIGSYKKYRNRRVE